MGVLRRLLIIYLPVVIITSIFAVCSAHAQAGACTNGPCVPTYHNDAMRDGVNSQETTLNPGLFPSQSTANFGLLVPTGGATGAVDGLIYAQPLYLSAVSMASTSGCSGTQNIVLVATENNSVYAFAWTYTLGASSYNFSLIQCWMLNFNRAGEYAMPFTALPLINKFGATCNNTIPQIGISSTPVIDTSVTPPVMYVVSAHQTASLTYTYRLHAINLSTGAEILNGTKAPYDLSHVFQKGITSNHENQRPGLALYNASSTSANVYVSFGSFCDTSPYSGYVAGLTYNYSTNSFAPVSATNWVFSSEASGTKKAGGIWMGGAAPGVDSAGNVYVAIANGAWDGASLFGQSVVKIATTSSGLVATDYYTPNDFQNLNFDTQTATVCSVYAPTGCPTQSLLTLRANDGDYDLGAGGVTLLSPVGLSNPVCGSNGELVAGGKEGVIYGICYNTATGSTLQNVMGGLDGCGYLCVNGSDPTLTACSQSSVPGNGSIAQCFQGANAGENQSNGSNTIFANPGIRGTEAFWPGNASNPQNYLYTAGSSTALVAYQADPATGLFNTAGNPAQTPKTYPYPGAVPSISWDGNNPGTALLWAIDSGGYGVWKPTTNSARAATPAILVVYNAVPDPNTHVLTELWESSGTAGNSGPGAVKFTVPTIAGGLVFVAGGSPGYAPGIPGGTGVNCTASALVNSTTPTVCGGMLSVYGKLHQ